jgi:predicted aspartyl protease
VIGEMFGSREALLPLIVAGDGPDAIPIRAVIDTGFTEYLCLSLETIVRLTLRFRRTKVMVMADGRTVATSVYRGFVNWDEVRRGILIHEGGDEPLAGMALLHGHRVTLDVVDGGAVTITPLA